jgi:hypothetical protein
MLARQLIGGAAFPPDVLKVISEAFDDAWVELAPGVHADAASIDAARVNLGTILLTLAQVGPIDRPETDGTTFTFLGFCHVWGKSRKGKSVVRQVTAKKRYAARWRR